MSCSALITGFSRDIGLDIAQAGQAADDRIAITYHSTLAPAGFLPAPCDIAQPDDLGPALLRIEEQHGSKEVLVSKAGFARERRLVMLTEDDFASGLDTYPTGACWVAVLAAHRVIRRREGWILFVSSVSALSRQAGQSNYAASEAGLIGFARSLGRELAPCRIRVNLLSRGLADTAMLSTLDAEKIEGLTAQVPLGRSEVLHPAEPRQGCLIAPGLGRPLSMVDGCPKRSRCLASIDGFRSHSELPTHGALREGVALGARCGFRIRC
ncbi:SDR family oxidoreductase [Streptomyces sp. BE20]|uniref:SDR family NAD(P)-dependent oxidoreductase n=1 Tax=Streptomyces sp. BE20 TaxID=3002525 RepID=UPI002E7939CF|nr:SDR family NAD(P)-dependent oxidoreductase [Streptomyces sp. BE20]MEE1823871.1 SDR family oxidoreductase [Streptomyces sp. BE20]